MGAYDVDVKDLFKVSGSERNGITLLSSISKTRERHHFFTQRVNLKAIKIISA